ncbi:MAG: hypothetical protein ACYCTW_07890 [Sulfuricella sp.]
MKTNKIRLALLGAGILTTALLTGCGGGGGGSTTSAAVTPTSVSGVAAKGIMKGAQVLVCRVKTGGPEADTSCTTGTTGSDGSYTVALADGWTGPVVVKIRAQPGTKVFNEISGSDDTVESGLELRAASATPSQNLNVTPFSDMATAAALKAVTANTDVITIANNIKTAVAAIQLKMGVNLATKPVVDLKNTSDPAELGRQVAMVKQLAKVVQMAEDTGAGNIGCGNLAGGTAAKLSCVVSKLDDAMDSPDTLNVANAAVLTTLNAQTVTKVYMPVIAANGSPSVQSVSTANQTADLTAAGIPAAAMPQVEATLSTEDGDFHDKLAAVTTAISAPGAGTTVPIIVPSTTALDGVAQAKAMFADLRTTLNAFSNGTKTGFLDTQAARMNTDLNANVIPEMSKVARRISTLGKAMGVFGDAKVYTSSNATQGFVYSTNPFTGTTTLGRQYGSVDAVMHGYGSYDYCWTDVNSISFLANVSKVTCAHAGSDSADRTNNLVKMVVFELTGTATNQYSYTATRYNMAVSVDQYGQVTPGAITVATGVPAGSGTVAKTVDATSGKTTGLTLNGTLPPSATTSTGTAAPGVDTVAISAARTALTAANNYHYALSGSVSTSNLADSSKVVTLSLNSGSYFDLDETYATTTGAKMVAEKLIGTAQTGATQFTGTLDIGSFMPDADLQKYVPTSVVFNGSISDTSTGGAGQILTGKLEGAVAGYNQYHSAQHESAANYVHATFTFTGTVTAPNRPVMTLVATVINGYNTTSGNRTFTISTKYTYGSGVAITGDGTYDDVVKSGSLTFTNQDGVKVVLNTNQVTNVTDSSGTNLATINNNTVNYADGVSESMM